MTGESFKWKTEEVLDCLRSVLDSQTFASSKHLRAFLNYVIVQKLEGEEDKLKAYTIAVDALGKPDSFDPQQDPTVRVVAGKLRTALNIYYGEEGAGAKIKFHIPKGTYRPEFLPNLIEPAPTATVSPIVTPVDASEIPTAQSGLWWMIPSAVGALAIIVGMALKIMSVESFDENHTPHAPIIAVAEFDNISGDSALDEFKSGLRFDLISELSRFSWLSTYAWKSDGNDKPSNGLIHADYILRGSLTSINNRIRISYRLESGDTGIVRWAQIFDRSVSSPDIFQMQTDTVQAIAIEIGSPGGILNQIEQNRYQRHAEDMNAYLCTLKLYDYWKTFAPKAHLEIRNCLENAIKINPNYGEAHGAVSYIYLYEALLGSNRRTGYDPLKRALQSATKAVKLDQFSTLSKQALYTANLFNGNIPEFVRIGQELVKLNPNNPGLLSDFGTKMAINAGMWDEGLIHLTNALQLNPNPDSTYFAGFALRALVLSEYEEILSWTDKMNSVEWPLYNMVRAIAQSQLKDLNATQASLANLNSKSAQAASRIVQSYHMHKTLESLFIQQLTLAYDYANSTS